MRLDALAKALAAAARLTREELEALADVIARQLDGGTSESGEVAPAPARSAAAERARRYRARHAQRDGGVTSGVTETAPRHGQSVTERDGRRDADALAIARTLSSQISSDPLQTKDLQIGSERGARARATPVTLPVTPSVTRDVTPLHDGATPVSRNAEALRKLLEKGFRSRSLAVPARYLTVPVTREVIEVSKSLPPERYAALVDGFFGSERARARGYPIAWLCANPAEYLPATSGPVVRESHEYVSRGGTLDEIEAQLREEDERHAAAQAQ